MAMNDPTVKKPLVVLIGAGPGDISLMSLAAVEYLRQADTVLYDRLANPEALALVSADTEKIDVGKRPDGHTLRQDQINDLLVAKYREGRLVVRLKGGDPYLFGRGGEEALRLAKEGCRFRVVPGITAAMATADYAGIPLTHRTKASSVVFVTGHEDPEKNESAIHWTALAQIDTVVFYMGVGNLASIADKLIHAGRGGRTPVAVVENAATPRQRTLVSSLARVAEDAAKANVRPPAIIIVGDVVTLHHKLGWYEKLPLFGKTVLVTRAREQASQLTARLQALGAAVIEAPVIRIEPPTDTTDLDAALMQLSEYDWLVLTSANGVSAVADRLGALDMDARALAGVKIAAVGAATANALNERFIKPDVIPETFTTTALGEALIATGVSGRRMLLARADIAPPDLAAALTAGGANVTDVIAYRTTRPDELPQTAAETLAAGRVDWVTLTASSTVENFLALAHDAGADLTNVKFAAIGPVTADTLEAHGHMPAVVAAPHTIDGLTRAIVQYETAP